MTLYLGIPDKEWSFLLSEAEELLVEDNIGIHVLGMYPCGDRIYGDESSTPGILCIYFDEPAELLNPCNDNIGVTQLSIGQGCSPVRFISLYKWVQIVSILNNPRCMFHQNLSHLIPPLHAPLYEDPQLTSLMDLAREYLQNRGWDAPAFTDCGPPQTGIIKYAAYLRMRLILQYTNIFAPCLNKSWSKDTVSLSEILPKASEVILRSDQELVEYYSGYRTREKLTDKNFHSFGRETMVLISKKIEYHKAEKEREALGQAVRDLYRSLL